MLAMKPENNKTPTISSFSPEFANIPTKIIVAIRMANDANIRQTIPQSKRKNDRTDLIAVLHQNFVKENRIASVTGTYAPITKAHR
jgi:hypothetical protein